MFERYQALLDQFQAMDGDNYESNIRKQLKLIGLQNHENTAISKLSGGEYKLLQVMKEMLVQPTLLIMDEPDVFLDFENLNGLCELINHYSGTLLVVTRTRSWSLSTAQQRKSTLTPAASASANASPKAGWVATLGRTSATPSI